MQCLIIYSIQEKHYLKCKQFFFTELCRDFREYPYARSIGMVHDVIVRDLGVVMDRLRDSTAFAPVPHNDDQRVVHAPGHNGTTYAQSKEPFLVHWSLVLNVPYGCLANFFTEDACIEAHLHMTLGIILMQDIIHWWWLRLRQYDDNLVPWKPGQSITDTNSQVLDPNHPIRKCCPITWNSRRDPTLSEKKFHYHHAIIKVWCPKHQKFETWSIPWIMLGQAALGLFDTDEWVFVVTMRNFQPHDMSYLESQSSNHIVFNMFVLTLKQTAMDAVTAISDAGICSSFAGSSIGTTLCAKLTMPCSSLNPTPAVYAELARYVRRP